MLQLVILLLGLILITYGLYKWATLNNEYFEKRGIPYMKPYFLVGNTGGFFFKKYSNYGFVSMIYNQLPLERVFGLFDMRIPFLFIRDPDIIKQLAVKDFDHFEDHKSFIDDKVDKLFGNSLFMLRGEKWRDMRATLSPAFTGSKMRQMFELVSACANEMTQHFIKKASRGEDLNCEMKELFSKYTNDVIASAAFGIKVNSFEDPENEFYKTGKKFSKMNNLLGILKIIFLRVVPSLMQKLNIQFVDENIANFFRNMVLDTMEVRDKEGIFRPDMINILMQVKKGNTNLQQKTTQLIPNEEKSTDGFATVEESNIGKRIIRRKWEDDELVAQCFLFFIAGFDTSSTMLSFLTYELALSTDIQQKLYEEVAETHKNLEGKQLTYDFLQNMKYMDMVLSEALRKWPAAGVVDRLCVKDYLYDDGNLKFTIEKNTSFWIPIYGIQRDPKYFPNPEKFDPERFSDENKDCIVPGTFIPFGIGPRNCIGSRFALMELKAVVYYLILNFKFQTNAKTQIPLKLRKTPMQVLTEKGISLELKIRK